MTVVRANIRKDGSGRTCRARRVYVGTDAESGGINRKGDDLMSENKTKEILLQGDCLSVLKAMDDNSVDSVVTDPPYGLSKEPDINEVLSKWLAGEEYDHGPGGFTGK